MLKAAGITKSFGAVRALDEVDFEIGRGEVVALAGENGSGKSTLVKVLAGAHSPDAGDISIDGELVRLGKPREALDHGIALVQQELTAVSGMTVAENVLLCRMPGVLSRYRRHEIVDRAREVLDFVGVDIDPSRTFASLKTGDRELVEVAKAIASEPRILILDEATSRLGEGHVERLFDIVRRLRDERGTSTILITHRLKEMVDVADRAVVLRDGRLAGHLPKEELTEVKLSSTMVGRTLGELYDKRVVEPGDSVLELDGLVVDGTDAPVSLSVRAGEIVALAGLVGSGRTEILETVAGARRAQAGRVLVGGKAVRNGVPSRALRAGIALVPEDRHHQGLNLQASIRRNVALTSWRWWRSGGRGEAALAQQAIANLKIKARGPDTPVRHLSGGNQQKVVIARCLTTDPSVLLLDEPTRGVDVGAKGELFRLVGDMVEKGMAIVLVTSDMLELLGLADRIVVLHERRVVAELSRESVTEERIAYLSAGGKDDQDGQ